MSYEEFKKTSLACIGKNRSHPKSPYDPITMKTYSLPSTNQNNQSALKTTPTTTPKAKSGKRSNNKRRRVDTSAFLDCDSENEMGTELNDTQKSNLGTAVGDPSSASTPKNSLHEHEKARYEQELNDAKKGTYFMLFYSLNIQTNNPLGIVNIFCLP